MLQQDDLQSLRLELDRERAARKDAESRLELGQSSKLAAIGQLAAGIAHELNTPIQYIGDNLHFLDEALSDLKKMCEAYLALWEAAQKHDDLQEYCRVVSDVREEIDIEYLEEEIPQSLEQSLDGVQRVSKIVLAMKEFSHPGSDEKKEVDLSRALNSTITVSRNEWKYVAELETDIEPQLPMVTCLPGEINQVFLNLIINAAHAIEEKVGKDRKEKGLIRIGARTAGERVEITISDTGAGIPLEIRERIFEPFFTTKEVGRGTGQGLAIARSVVVDKHGGELKLESEVGQGTTFHIFLPIRSDDGGDGS
ncbi:ATP-binding protein [Candidatus Sumerlaeota bacterium]|nr:ATP-binding protein [Candidatus Sumerlaeota bacterium]